MAACRLSWPSILVLVLSLGACGGGASVPAPAPAPAPGVQPSATADISVLMFGNSHTAANALPAMLSAMLVAGRPGKTVAVVNAPNYATLEERMHDQTSRAQLGSQKWSALVLQAQQYSTSGMFEYSTSEAVEWVRLARAAGTLPVMFPEWARRGIDETERIYTLHAGIAKQQPACVAPVPQAWDLAAARYPSLALHDADGNHSNPAGAFLAALVLYATITGEPPAALPGFPQFPVPADVQANLRKVADDQVKLVSPRLYCPGDPRL
jgi:hypothetical protein